MSINTEKLDLFKYDPIIDKDQTFNITTALNNNWDKIDNSIGAKNGVAPLDSDGLIPSEHLPASRNLGEIVTSTIALSDSALHLLDGSILTYGSYKNFIDYISTLVSVNTEIFCTEEEFQTSITNYGVCGKYVYDNINNTLRLPKIEGFIEGTLDLTSIGKLVEAGLPNITGRIAKAANGSSDSQFLTDSLMNNIEKTGALYIKSTQEVSTIANTTSYQNGASSIDFDASRANSIYGNSDIVQPQATKVLYYVVIATSTKIDIQVNIDEIATDLSSKADKDGTNMVNQLSNSAREYLKNLSRPNYSQEITKPNAGFTADKDGWLKCFTKSLGYNAIVFINNNEVHNGTSSGSSSISIRCTSLVPISKGDVITTSIGSNSSVIFTFFPNKED